MALVFYSFTEAASGIPHGNSNSELLLLKWGTKKKIYSFFFLLDDVYVHETFDDCLPEFMASCWKQKEGLITCIILLVLIKVRTVLLEVAYKCNSLLVNYAIREDTN